MALCGRKRAPTLHVVGIHAVRDVIEEQAKVVTSQCHHLPETLFETTQLRVVTKANIQSGTQGVDKADVEFSAGTEQLAKLFRFVGWVWFTPEDPML